MNDKEISKAVKRYKKEIEYASKKVKKRTDKFKYFWKEEGVKVRICYYSYLIEKDIFFLKMM